VNKRLMIETVSVCLAVSLSGCCGWSTGPAERAAAMLRVEKAGAAAPQSVRAQASRKLTDKRLVAKFAEKEARTAVDAIWLGDSITHFWDEEWTGGPEVFAEKFGRYSILNFGFGGDKTQNVLWLIENAGVLDGIEAKVVNLMIGTNNMWRDTPEDIAAGIAACVKAIRVRQPKAKVVLMSILPREVAHVRNGRDYTKNRLEGIRDQVMPKTVAVNGMIRFLADGRDVIWLDLTAKFTDKDGLSELSLFCDGTHPNAAGYKVMADEILGLYERL